MFIFTDIYIYILIHRLRIKNHFTLKNYFCPTLSKESKSLTHKSWMKLMEVQDIVVHLNLWFLYKNTHVVYAPCLVTTFVIMIFFFLALLMRERDW